MKNLIPWRRHNRETAHFFWSFFQRADILWQGFIFRCELVPQCGCEWRQKRYHRKSRNSGCWSQGYRYFTGWPLFNNQGEKKHEKEESDEHYYRVESSFGYYQRTIELPADVDSASVDATYKNGVLKLKLKKLKPVETRTINISTG